ncbi:MAG: hypothetical protein V3T08_05925 [Gemmatimonadota bacterium]
MASAPDPAVLSVALGPIHTGYAGAQLQGNAAGCLPLLDAQSPAELEGHREIVLLVTGRRWIVVLVE